VDGGKGTGAKIGGGFRLSQLALKLTRMISRSVRIDIRELYFFILLLLFFFILN
jgi:hypothetical protein